jgi:hypothetical protein
MWLKEAQIKASFLGDLFYFEVFKCHLYTDDFQTYFLSLHFSNKLQPHEYHCPLTSIPQCHTDI